MHTPAWWRRFIYSGKERYLSAQECLRPGLVDEVCQFLEECYITSASAANREQLRRSEFVRGAESIDPSHPVRGRASS